METKRQKETRAVWYSLAFLAIITLVYFILLILNPPPFHDWVDHDRWYDLTLQTT